MKLSMRHIATDIPVDVELDLVEQSWAKDKNPTTLNLSWDKHCDSVARRTGHDIQGNFEIETIDGRAFH
jgi:hypothetical protein